MSVAKRILVVCSFFFLKKRQICLIPASFTMFYHQFVYLSLGLMESLKWSWRANWKFGCLKKMGSSKPGLFAREATGLVREIGFSLGVIIILSHVIGLGWQKRAFQFSGPMPMPTDMMPLGLPAMFWAFLVVGLVVLVTGYAAGYVAAAMPRSGGGYVTISRVIHPVVGYMSGWLMFLAEAFSYGLIGVAVFEGVGIFFNIALASPGVATPGWLSCYGRSCDDFRRRSALSLGVRYSRVVRHKNVRAIDGSHVLRSRSNHRSVLCHVDSWSIESSSSRGWVYEGHWSFAASIR